VCGCSGATGRARATTTERRRCTANTTTNDTNNDTTDNTANSATGSESGERLCVIEADGLTMVFTAEIAHAESGHRLAAQQADAIRAILEWVAANPETPTTDNDD
jgi:hypothetical protein